jgi:hypothetical protein
MRKLELTIVPLLVMSLLSPAAGQSVVRRDSAAPAPASLSQPAASQAHPDVLGIKVGVSSVEDVRSILSGTALALRVSESLAQLFGQLSSGFGHVAIPNGEYVDFITGVSNTYQGPENQPCGGYLAKNCQELRADFSAPPNPGTVMALTRSIAFVDGPLTATVIKELVDKYGQFGFRTSYGDNGVALSWAWARDGSAMALNARHICASQGMAMTRQIDESKGALQAGCAAMLFVGLAQENSITKSETLYLIDHYDIVAEDAKTKAFTARGVANYEACERAAAAKRTVPSEFSNDPTSTKASRPAADSASSCTPVRPAVPRTGPCARGCGFLTVTFTGGPTRVYIDGGVSAIGMTPLINYRLSAGMHRIEIRLPNHPVSEPLQIDSGATVVKSYGTARP